MGGGREERATHERGLHISRPPLLLKLGVSFESLSSLSFTSLDMRQPYSKPYSDKNSLFQIIIIINLPYLVNY